MTRAISPWTVRAWQGEKMLKATTHTVTIDKDARVSELKQGIRRGEISRIDVLDHRNAEIRTIYF